MDIKANLLILLSTYLLVVENKKKKNKAVAKNNKEDEYLTQYIILSLSVIVLLVALIYFLKKRAILMRAQKLKSIRRAIQVKQEGRKDKTCTMTQMQKQEAIAWFCKQNWVLEQSYPKQKPVKTPLQIISMSRKQQKIDGSKLLKDYYDAFYVQMKGASANIFGVIMFEKYYMTFLFEKSVSNSKNERGTYDYKFYDGLQKKGVFEGKSYYSNDEMIDAERQSIRQKQTSLSKVASQRSFLKNQKESEDSSLLRSKKVNGTFKLYHQ